MTSCKYLYFNHNHISSLPQSIYDMKSLTVLLLENNKLEDVDLNSVFKMKTIEVMNLSANKLTE